MDTQGHARAHARLVRLPSLLFPPRKTTTTNGGTPLLSLRYAIPSFLSIPEKTQLAAANLVPDAHEPFPGPVLNISYFSAASFPLAFPPTIARGFGWPHWGFGVEGVNGRLGRWLLDRLGRDGGGDGDARVRGWALLDFYAEPEGADGVVPLLVECNFRGRRRGEEGW